jgi:signal transduction histidine kinase
MGIVTRGRRRTKTWRPPHLALSLIVVGTIAFAVTAYMGHRGLREVTEHSAQTREADETLRLINQSVQLLGDMDIGQRGFMLSGREESLDPYVAARRELPAVFTALMGRLEHDHGKADWFYAMQRRFDELIARRIEIAESNIKVRRSVGVADSGIFLPADLDGQAVMDQLRTELGGLAQMHVVRSKQRDIESIAAQEHTTVLMSSLSAGGVALMFLALWLLVRERRMRDRAEMALRKFNNMLESIVADRTEEVQLARDRIRSFASELDQSIEAERRRLAREVHDQFGQIATGTKLVVQQMARDHPDLPRPTVDRLTGLIDESIGMARRIASELRPPLLDDLGFAAAVSYAAQRMSASMPMALSTQIDDDDRLTPNQANQLFRILQEAATNTLRHAQATRLSATGQVDDGHYVLRVVDDGIGPQSVRPDASGLRNMRERAALVGGSFHFGPVEPHGTEIVVRVPLAAQEVA